MGKIAYLTSIRMPTALGHGVYIAKMCEAFARLGGDVTLLHSRRRGHPASVFEYYGVPRVFDARPLRDVDVMRWRRRLPTRMRMPVTAVHYLVRALVVALQARRVRASLYVTPDAEIALWSVLLGLPTLLDLHEPLGAHRRRVLGPLTRSRHLVAVSTVTSYTRQWLVAAGFRADRTAVLPNGVDLRVFADLPSPEACRERLGLLGSGPIVGYIGRFRAVGREKGIPELVRAMSLLDAAGREAPRLLCVGGPMEAVPAYLQVAAEVGLPRQRLRFVDRVPTWEVPLWMRACDLVTVPWPWSEFSAYVTCPLKLFEYMAAERPIVASDLPSTREILRHGQDAWLVKPGDPAALAGGIAHLLGARELATQLGRQARQTVEAHTWERRAAAMWQHANGG